LPPGAGVFVVVGGVLCQTIHSEETEKQAIGGKQ